MQVHQWAPIPGSWLHVAACIEYLTSDLQAFFSWWVNHSRQSLSANLFHAILDLSINLYIYHMHAIPTAPLESSTSKCGQGHQAQTSPVEVYIFWLDTADLSDHGLIAILQKVWLGSKAKLHWHGAPGSARMSCTHDNRSCTQGTTGSSLYKALVDPNFHLKL